MPSLEKYFKKQIQAHQCQLPPSDDLEYLKQVKKFKNVFLISEKNLRSYLKVGSLSAIFYEKRRQVRTTSAVVVHPFSPFRRIWQFLMCFFLFFCVILFPMFSAFHGPFYAKSLFRNGRSFVSFYVFLAVMVLLQLFCFVEIIINFMTGYVSTSTEEIVIHPMGIARHYMCTYFFFDVLSAIPLDALLVFILGVRKYSDLSRVYVIILNIFPLLKLSCLRTLALNFHSIFDYISSSYCIYKMVVVSVLYFLIVHWSACLMMIFPRWVYFEELFYYTNETCNYSWVLNQNLTQELILYQYVTSVYRAVTCFSSAGFNIPCLRGLLDKVVSLVIAVAGKIYEIVLSVVFLQMISTLFTGRIRYLEMIDQVKQYMRLKKFPRKLRQKILINYIYLFQKQHVGEGEILKLLSINLRREILLKVHQTFIKKVLLFSGLRQTVILDVINCLKPEIYLEQDVIYKAGEKGESMFFISFGTVAMYTADGIELCHIDDGNHFGEITLLLQTNRILTAIAVETTELLKLGAKDFDYLTTTHPTLLSKLDKSATERYNLLYMEKEKQEKSKGAEGIIRN